jgi:hypothetical protein
VLDSSGLDASAQVAAMCAAAGDTVHQPYPSDIYFYAKLADGVRRHVRTPAACICADDDFVLPEALAAAARLVLGDATVALAHGHYAQFVLDGGGRITSLTSARPEIVRSQAMHRVAEGLADYEATIYAMHRTEVLVEVLEEAAQAPNLFTAEILTAALALFRGAARRIDEFTHARNIAPSHGSKNWHPAELLATDPRLLIEGLAYIRDRLGARLGAECETELKLYDLAVLAYVAGYVKPATTRRLARLALEGVSADQRRAIGWSDFVAAALPGGPLSRLRRSALGRWLVAALARYHGLDQAVRRLVRGGLRRSERVSIALPDGRTVPVVFESGRGRHRSLSRLRDNRSDLRLAKALALYSQGAAA